MKDHVITAHMISTNLSMIVYKHSNIVSISDDTITDQWIALSAINIYTCSIYTITNIS